MSIPALAALAALPPARCTRSLDSDSLSGSLSDSDFVSTSSTPPIVDTAATSDDDEQQHAPCEPKRMSDEQVRPPSCPKQPRHPRRAASSSTNPYLSCTSSLLRTTLFSFARIGLGSTTTGSTGSTGSPASSSSRRSSVSYPSSTGSPIESPSLHANPTVEICPNSNPSLAQFSPTPPASSSLAIYAPHSQTHSQTHSHTAHSTSRRHGLRSRSASSSVRQQQHAHTTAHTAHSGSRPRTHSLAFRIPADDGVTSPLHQQQDSVASPSRFAAFWRKQPLAQRVGDANSPASSPPSTLVLPSISRAHVPDLVLPTSVDGSSSDLLPAPSTAAEDGFLKIDGSRDGLSFRTAENGTQGAFFVGTPRPSYPMSQAPEHDDLTVLVDSPVGDDDDGLPKFEWKDKGKGKERATLPNEYYTPRLPAASASIPIPIPTSPTTSQIQTPQRRIKIVLPPPPVRAATTPTPVLRQPRPVAAAAPAPTPPTLATVEQASRLMRDQAHCATCAVVGVDFPRCPRCAEAWCSRACRVARMDALADGRRKHVCKA